MWHVGYETARHAVACMCVCKFAHASDDYMRQIPKELRIGEYQTPDEVTTDTVTTCSNTTLESVASQNKYVRTLHITCTQTNVNTGIADQETEVRGLPGQLPQFHNNLQSCSTSFAQCCWVTKDIVVTKQRKRKVFRPMQDNTATCTHGLCFYLKSCALI